MSDREALAAALKNYTPNPAIVPYDEEQRQLLDRYWDDRALIVAAAEERLAQLPETNDAIRSDLLCEPEIMTVRAGILARTPDDHMLRIGVIGNSETKARELFYQALEQWSKLMDAVDAAAVADGETP